MATAANTIYFIPAIVDQLGQIKARIAELKAEEAHLVAIIANTGESAFDGETFRATVSEVAERKSLDAKAAEVKLRELGVDGRWFSKNQKTSKAYKTVKVVARKS